MTTITAIFNAFAPEYLARSPTLPDSHHKVLHAIQHCRRGLSGHSLSQCQSCGKQHRVNHACGNRHCPQCQHHTTQLWLYHQREQQLPGPHFLLTFTVPEMLRPFIRSHPRLAYHAMCKASSTALTRLAHEARCIGTPFPGFPGLLHTWGRQLQFHPHIHSIVPGSGLAKDTLQRLPSRAHFLVPVKALSPISRALFTEEIHHAARLSQIDPQVWTIPWNVHRQAQPHGHAAFPSLAPSVFRVAIANPRLVSLQDRPVPFPSRQVGRARPRTAHLDVRELLRRFLPPVFPDGFMQVRHGGLLHASCALPPDTLCLLIVQAHPLDGQPPPRRPPQPLAVRCPTCGAPRRVVLRLWTSHSGLVDTGGEAGRCPDDRGATRWGKPTAPVRPHPALRPHQAAEDRSATAFQRPAYASRGSSAAPMAMPHHGLRRTIPPLSWRHTL